MDKLKIILVVLILSSISNFKAQTKTELFKTIKAKDSLLFKIGFNECKLNLIEKLVVDDIEFYHDKDGITKSKTKFVSSINNNLCSSGKNILNRTLDDVPFEVFPLYKENKLYGALQKGMHSFGNTKASYSHLWLLEKKEWKLARVVSYNHHKFQNSSKNNYIKLATTDLEKYVGNYEFSPEFVLTIKIKNGALYGESQGQGVKINCYEKNKFIDEEQTHDLEFLVDKKGVVSGLLMKGDGMKMTAKKVKK